jgi:hypothetical protein
MERQERGLGVVVVIIIIITEAVSSVAASTAGPCVPGREAWRAADDAAFDGAVGGGGRGR